MFSELNKIATIFSIKDLENLTGIQAHTIRIWEKRYGILSPERTDTNIRYYNISNLKKLLNVHLLNQAGMKISNIAKLPESELLEKVRELESTLQGDTQYQNSLLLAMFQFDQALFENTYNKMTAESSFRRVFLDFFVPLLQKVGLDWQSDSITPAHEHFISNLIKQKLHINIERVQQTSVQIRDRVFVLFLPENEIHELGLLYIHYELILKGYRSIFLGQSVPMENLSSVQILYDNICFISYFTVQPWKDDVHSYLVKFRKEVLVEKKDQLWILGMNCQDVKLGADLEGIKRYEGIEDLLAGL